MIGSTVMQRFEIHDRLGSGGFGTVYRAWDRRLERFVAVKVVETSPRTGARIRREAQAAARLNHPGIVTLFEFTHHEFGAEGGRAFLVSELVEGDTLRDLVDRELLSDREVAEIGADICEALDHAHAHGVVHRDIKPANLIYPYRNGGAKLMDFGIARLTDADDLTNTGDVLGTLSYMAPEQAEGLAVGPAGDVYSLALTLYEAWTGENPRRRATPGATARALDEDVPLLADARPDLPARLTETVDACLDRDPELRPAIEEIGTVLEDSLNLLEDAPRRPAETGKPGARLGARRFAGVDAVRIAGAAVTAGMAATGMIVTGEADAASVALVFIAAAVLTLLHPRIGFLAAGGGLAAWLIAVAGMPGAALPVLLLTVVPTLLMRGSGTCLAAIPLGPLLGTVGLAPVVPGLAALAANWRDRAVVAAAGLTVTALAEAVTGRGLLFDRFAEVPAGWESSVTSCLADLMIPVMTSTTFLVALAVWVGGALLLGAIIARLRAAAEPAQGEVVTFAPVGSERL
jgi:hypothetical protein